MFFEVFHSSSRYLDDLLNIDNPYFAIKSEASISS